MQTSDIRALARHQHLRGVGVVEWTTQGQRVRIRVPLDSAAAHGVAARAEPAAGPTSSVVESALTVVRAEGLGWLRFTHPARLSERVIVGDEVRAGQPLALLQVGGTYTAVSAPHDGRVLAVLAEEGQRIDHGTALFQLKGPV